MGRKRVTVRMVRKGKKKEGWKSRGLRTIMTE